MLSVHQHHPNTLRGQNVIERDGVNSRGLHRHRVDAAGGQPDRHAFQIRRPTTEFLYRIRIPVRRYGHKVTLVAHVNPAGIRVDDRQAGIIAS